MGSFSYTLKSVRSFVGFGSLSYTARDGVCLVILQVGSMSYTPHAGICLFVPRVGSFSYASPVYESVSSFAEESLIRARVEISLVIRWCGSLFYTPLPRSCLVVQWVGSLSYTPGCQLGQVVQRIYRVSYTPRAGMCLLVRRIGSLWGVSLTR